VIILSNLPAFVVGISGASVVVISGASEVVIFGAGRNKICKSKVRSIKAN